jgi:hypothetical protein
MSFSIRQGYKSNDTTIQSESISEDLRNSIWNVLDLTIWQPALYSMYNLGGSQFTMFCTSLWFEYFKQPIDKMPDNINQRLAFIRSYFFGCKWYEVYDLIEFILNHFDNYKSKEEMNTILEREFSGYRYVGDCITPLTSEEEIKAVSDAVNSDEFSGVKVHLQTALNLFSNRQSPDYRNSIKESMSAVESILRVIADNSNAKLVAVLKKLSKDNKIHPALESAFTSLYGYTSDAEGIRHSLLDDSSLGPEDARFFLVSCSAFINYLKAKI